MEALRGNKGTQNKEQRLEGKPIETTYTLWRDPCFTDYLPTYQLSFLQSHEVGRKITSVPLGLRKPRLCGQEFVFLYIVPYPTPLCTLRN